MSKSALGYILVVGFIFAAAGTYRLSNARPTISQQMSEEILSSYSEFKEDYDKEETECYSVVGHYALDFPALAPQIREALEDDVITNLEFRKIRDSYHELLQDKVREEGKNKLKSILSETF